MAFRLDVSADINAIERDIQEIKQQLDQYEDILKRAESGHASVSFLNEKYHAIILSTKDLTQHLKALRSASHAPGVSDELRVRARNLHEQAISQTTRIQRIGRETQRISSVLARAASSGAQFRGGDPALTAAQAGVGTAQQAQIQLRQREDEHLARDMEALEADIVLVNELFTTLATYVHDQGELVDSIEANTEAAYVQIQTGTQQLTTAVQHRKSARRRKCICALVFVIAIVIIGLIIGLSLRGNNP